ncbi:MAG: thioredoxin domain-containing protein, partial [Rhodanobacteraceae bacterium]
MRNELARASSPYLRQHAGNPVHWQEWNEATLAYAKQADAPILLSIGYSACHWCHVMAHESFEDDAIARVMNALFVNVKLDREERPDLDRVYQLAHRALSGRGGGWPLTVFLDPQDLTPFFAGTYFPPSPRHGLPGFGELLQRVRGYYDTHRDELRGQNDRLREWLAGAGTVSSEEIPTTDAVTEIAVQRIAARFDPDNGGTRGAPKFPHAGELELLLDIALEPLSREGDKGEGSHLEDPGDEPNPHPALGATLSQREQEEEKTMALLTLRTMAARGLQDHLGGGFFRYCVDAAWTIPHFEKMLYDNAQLLPLYARAAAAFEDPACAQAVRGIVAWLQREMTTPGGAFVSALDADSAGEEGKFYLWTREELRTILDDEEFAAIEAGYGLDGAPNYEGRAWHLVKAQTFEQIAQAMARPPQEIQRLLNSARRKLFNART